VKEYRRYVMREIMHHGGLKHPFIVDLKEVFLTPDYLAIVMEYAQGGNVSGPAGGGCKPPLRVQRAGRLGISCWERSASQPAPHRLAPPPSHVQLHRFLRERCLHNRLTEDQARWIFQQMVVGLDFCHRMVRRPLPRRGWRRLPASKAAAHHPPPCCAGAACSSCMPGRQPALQAHTSTPSHTHPIES
jgi:serine/threonine protein kinase